MPEAEARATLARLLFVEYPAFAYDRVPFLRLIAARIAGEAVNVMTAVAPVGGDAIKVSPEPGVTTI